MTRISSEIAAAESAVTALTGVKLDARQDQQTNITFSNVGGMRELEAVSNVLLGDFVALIAATYAQAKKIPSLAQAIESRDGADTGGF